MHHRSSITIAVIVLLSVTTVAYWLFSEYVPPPEFDGQSPIEVKMVHMGLPTPERSVKIGVFAKLQEKCNDLVISAQTDRGFEFISGKDYWNGKVFNNGVARIAFIVKPVGYGEFSITGTAYCRDIENNAKASVKNTYDMNPGTTTFTTETLI